MTDISSKDDIDVVVRSFYKQAIEDELIGVFFTQVVELDFQEHIPIIVNFWESVLLGGRSYQGRNPMVKHIQLNRLKHLEKKHFERWLFIWENTVNQHYKGVIADIAIKRANGIGNLMQHKIAQNSTKL